MNISTITIQFGDSLQSKLSSAEILLLSESRKGVRNLWADGVFQQWPRWANLPVRQFADTHIQYCSCPNFLAIQRKHSGILNYNMILAWQARLEKGYGVPYHCDLSVFPYKCIRDQSWPLRKKVKGQARIIIWRNLVVLKYRMLHTKFQDHRLLGSGEEAF